MLIITAIVLAGLILAAAAFFRKEKEGAQGSSSPFECGFRRVRPGRVPFSLQFYSMALIFLVFDVEILILFPRFLHLGGGRGLSRLVYSVGFLLALTAGLVWEWHQGGIDWKGGINK